jgi:CHAD domain-containing protein
VTDTNVFQLSQPGTFADPLTEVLRDGARALLAQAVEAEVAAFLTCHADKLTEAGRQRLVRPWIEAGEWSHADGQAARAPHQRPIEIHAGEQLARWRKKIAKKAKAFDRLDAGQRHKLRIAVKKFRYATEFVANVWLELLRAFRRCLRCLQRTCQAPARRIVGGIPWWYQSRGRQAELFRNNLDIPTPHELGRYGLSGTRP